LAGPLEWRRWADRGEFWDAWDIAADYRQHPLPWDWQGGPQWLARGPLCAHGRWRGRCGGSPVRLDLRLLAGSPWPAEPRTAREKARWEVPAISWLASVTAAGSGAAGGALEVPGCGPGLAVLLDGPQGISATPQRLGVSLLRAPTWPDPGADNGWQRQRLALLPCLAGWRPAQVGQQARRLREPLWVRPAGLADAGAPAGSGWPGFPALGEDLRLVGLRLAAPGPGDTQAERGTRSAEEGSVGGADLVLSVQNEGPCRRRLTLPPPWLVLERLDGLGQFLPPGDRQPDLLDLAPWQLAFWRLRWGGASVVVQSS
jgi:alpha-mannosidase